MTTTRHVHPLLDLPLELVVQIVEHLRPDKKTLCSLARTCRLLQIECERRIYTTIELLSTNDLHAILEAFLRRPERVTAVEKLHILYRFHIGLDLTSQERQTFNQHVANMKALKDWHIESPFDNFQWDEGGEEWVEQDMEQFRRALEAASLQVENGQISQRMDVGLSKLEKLVIHSHGTTSDFWDLDGFHCLFRHPSLRFLHVSCIALPKDLPELESYAKTTPLITLVFNECELSAESLRRILATPKLLKHLTLGENVYNNNEERSRLMLPKLSQTPLPSLEALAEVAHSLETLKHHDPLWRTNVDIYKHRPIKGDGMRQFHSLKLVNIDPCSFLHQFVLTHAQAPPNLETLQIRHADTRVLEMANYSMFDLFEQLPKLEPYTYIESLKTLELVQGTSLEMPMSKPEHICSPDAVRERHASAFKLHKHGINLKLFLEASWRSSLMPPYLHGEPKPELVCVYDAEQVGFHRRINEDADFNYGSQWQFWRGYLRPSADVFARDLAPARTGPPGSQKYSSRTASTEAEKELKELPETDQLNGSDILGLRNEVRRSIMSLWTRMAQMGNEESPNIVIILSNPPVEVEVEEEEEEEEEEEDIDEDDLDEDGDIWFDLEDDDDDDDEDMPVDGTAEFDLAAEIEGIQEIADDVTEYEDAELEAEEVGFGFGGNS